MRCGIALRVCYVPTNPGVGMDHEGIPRASPPSGGLVLCVEPDDDMRDVCSDVLRDAGYEVVAVATFADVSEAMASAVPELVLTDLHLADGAGLSLVARIRACVRHDHVRIVAMSGRCSRRAIEATLAAGCNAFLAKPFDRSDLVECMAREMAASRASRRPPAG